MSAAAMHMECLLQNFFAKMQNDTTLFITIYLIFKNSIMKNLKQFLAFTFLVAIMAACKKGEIGPQGPEGPVGPQGIAGNANVTQYSFGTLDLENNTNIDLAINTSADTMNRSLWLVYISYAGGNEYFYALPGFGYNAATYYRNSFYFNTSLNKVVHSITKVAGIGEVYSGAKIIRVYANNVVNPGGRMIMPPVDVKDYNAVKQYYGLP
jgi:hypothetical protein